jgi:hypothetical protein
MGIKIGSILGAMVGISALVAEPTLELRLTTLEGASVERIEVGVPYLLELIGKEIPNIQSVEIPGLSSLYHESRGAYQTITTINGVTQRTTQVTYYIRADKPGVYTVGPLQMDIGSAIVTASALNIEAVVEQKQYTREKKSPLFIEMTTEKERIVAGESIPITVTLYARSDIKILESSQPSMEKTSLGTPVWSDVSQGTTRLDGVGYRYAQWQTRLTPAHPGQLVIPAVKIVCVVQKSMHAMHDFMGQMFRNFGFGNQQQEIASKALPIMVDPLPPHAGPVDAVGSFDEISLHLNQDQARVGEGVVITLELLGTGDLDSIKQPSLKLPEGLRYYASKAVVVPVAGTTKQKKICEYIVQAHQAGNYHIEPQQFTFFDVDRRKYCTLCSQEALLEIQGATKTMPTSSQVMSIGGEASATNQVYKELNLSGPWLARSAYIIPWRLFFVILLLPLMVSGLPLYRFLLVRWRSRPGMLRVQAFSLAEARLKLCEQQQAPQNLYDIFMNLFAEIFEQPGVLVHENSICQALQKISLSDEQRMRWNEFFSRIAGYAYAPNNVSDSAFLFKQARYWLYLFKEVL